MKLWDKGYDIDRFTEEFTIGKDRELDVMLAKADVLGNMAHLKMLHHIGLISDGELKDLAQGLKDIFAEIEQGKFHIEAGIEDIHSQIASSPESVGKPVKRFIQGVPVMIRY